jgi:hypothetical protein
VRWRTRERVRMDRVACAWLIRKFIDAEAEFSFVSPKDAQVMRADDGVIDFVIPGAELSRKGDRITFDVMLEKYALTDPALFLLADIVRAADIRGLSVPPPEADGLRAVVHGFFLMELPDEEVLSRQYPLFDALYGYCQDQVRRRRD